MSYKNLPYLTILIVFLIVVSLCGCKFRKNKIASKTVYHEFESFEIDGDSVDEFESFEVGTVEVEDVGKSGSSGKTSTIKRRIFGRRRNIKKEDIESTVVTHSQSIATANEKEKKRLDLRSDNNKPKLARETNPVSASNNLNNKSVSVEDNINELVRRMAKAVPETRKLRISIIEFPDMKGEVTGFSQFLYEELITSFSSNSKFEVVGSLQTIIGKNSAEIDAIVTGSIMNLIDSVKVNVRLMLKKTGLIATAVSTSFPKNKAMERLMGKKREVLKVKTKKSDLYSQIDDLAKQLVNCLPHGKKQKIVLLEFTDLNGEVSKFSKFLFQELVTRLFLADSKKIEIVDNNIINEFMKVHHLSLHELAYPEFSKKLADSLGVNSIVKGIITDLGNSIKLNARIITADTGSLFGVAAIDIVKDEKLAKLFDEKVKVRNFEVDKSEIEKEEDGNTGFLLIDDNVFFNEDFSNYEEGHLLSEWGRGLIVKKDEGNKNFLTSDYDEFSVARQEVQFPEEFSFEFEVKGNSKYWSSIRFKDSDGKEFQVSFRLFQDLLSITLPGPKQVKTEIDINKYTRIKIIKKSKLYELHTNGSLLLVGSYSNYKDFKSFDIHSAFKRFQFTDFIGNSLVEN